ncbi:MAG: DUF1592 domain-containing protein [Deltaproteobacteria bacterium]
MKRSTSRVFPPAVAVWLVLGCSAPGEDTGPGTAPSGNAPSAVDPQGNPPLTQSCPADSFQAPLQMLNEFELRNTLRDLLGGVNAEVLIPTGARGAYRGALLIDQLPSRWQETAWQIATDAVQNVAGLTGCALANQDDACARTFIESFGSRAYRRPLATPEVDALVALYDSAKAEGFGAGIEMVLAAMLQHPSLLYRVEAGIADSVAGEPTLRRLSGYEVAQRLSYNFWGSMPDAALFAAAAAGELSTPEGVRAHAERMLLDERSTPMFADFVGQWLFTDYLGAIAKNAARYPSYTPDIPPLLKQELQLFVQNLVRAGGDLNELFTADYGFLNSKLAAFYGVPGVFGDQLTQTSFPPAAERVGLLTFAGLLSTEGTIQGVSLSSASRTYPIGRGRFIRRRLACEGVPPPIPNATMLTGVPEKIAALNQRFGGTENTPPRVFFEEVTSSNQICKACHSFLEPLGFVLERYGADGLLRQLDIDGTPVITAGTYAANGNSNPDLAGDYASPGELGQALAQSPGVKNCLSDHWLQYSLGRTLSATDYSCFGNPAAGGAVSVGTTPLKDIYLDVVTSDIYRIRKFD